LPAPGPLLKFLVPEGDGLRVDTGFESGDEVRPDFDPMIAKIITHGSDRSLAVERMRHALSKCVVLGTRTNLEFLQDLMVDEQLCEHYVDTGYLERSYSQWCWSREPSDTAWALAALARDLKSRRGEGADEDDGDRYSPWSMGIATFGAGGLP
jgi:acetyl/propionyl-CoA carboxylase alpha subunit